ncbi:MAG: RluA family pseudouridine synthase [Polyangiaceae bacterium]|nr:RluA family pseudouridine synthase [Polyangiaceae bacterium]
MTEALRVLFSSPDFVIVDKPAGIPTEPGKERGESLRDRVAAWIAEQGARDRAAPHAVSRLDTNVTGAVVFTRSPRGAKVLASAKERGDYRRVYVALAYGSTPPEGTWRTPVDGRDAETSFRALGVAGPGRKPVTLLEALPRTGRTHQIRIHASAAGAPLAGDRRYGGPSTVATPAGAMISVSRPMLHALAVSFPDASGTRVIATAPVPADMAALWSALDGRPEAWEEPQRS